MTKELEPEEIRAAEVDLSGPGLDLSFLETEYNMANQWAMHGENLSHRIFSFYVTLVTATLGGALAIGQGLSQSFQSSLLTIGAGCIILTLAGPVFFEALVRDHIRNVAYRSRMDQIRNALVKNAQADLLLTVLSHGSGPHTMGDVLTDPYQPSAIQYTMVGLINSVLAALAVPCILWGIAGPGYRVLPTLIASVITLFVAFALHRVAAWILIRRHKPTHNR